MGAIRRHGRHRALSSSRCWGHRRRRSCDPLRPAWPGKPGCGSQPAGREDRVARGGRARWRRSAPSRWYVRLPSACGPSGRKSIDRGSRLRWGRSLRKPPRIAPRRRTVSGQRRSAASRCRRPREGRSTGKTGRCHRAVHSCRPPRPRASDRPQSADERVAIRGRTACPRTGRQTSARYRRGQRFASAVRQRAFRGRRFLMGGTAGRRNAKATAPAMINVTAQCWRCEAVRCRPGTLRRLQSCGAHHQRAAGTVRRVGIHRLRVSWRAGRCRLSADRQPGRRVEQLVVRRGRANPTARWRTIERPNTRFIARSRDDAGRLRGARMPLCATRSRGRTHRDRRYR